MHKDRLKVFGGGNWVNCSELCDNIKRLQQEYTHLNLTPIVEKLNVRGGKYILMSVANEMFKDNEIPIIIIENDNGVEYVVNI